MTSSATTAANPPIPRQRRCHPAARKRQNHSDHGKTERPEVDQPGNVRATRQGPAAGKISPQESWKRSQQDVGSPRDSRRRGLAAPEDRPPSRAQRHEKSRRAEAASEHQQADLGNARGECQGPIRQRGKEKESRRHARRAREDKADHDAGGLLSRLAPRQDPPAAVPIRNPAQAVHCAASAEGNNCSVNRSKAAAPIPAASDAINGQTTAATRDSILLAADGCTIGCRGRVAMRIALPATAIHAAHSRPSQARRSAPLPAIP